jgi:hypothetical protein
LLYVTDLPADGGKKEIQDEVRALLTQAVSETLSVTRMKQKGHS